jgi:hypothetical protein
MNLRDEKNFLSVGGNFAKHLYLLKKAVLAIEMVLAQETIQFMCDCDL